MLIKSNGLNRRRILRGMLSGGAVTVSLPFLNAFLNENGTALAATGAPLPERFGTWFWGLGVDPSIFVPKTFGANWEVPLQLKAITKVKQHVNVISNFNVVTDGAPNLCHFTGWAALRTGTAPAGRGATAGQSLDTVISERIGAGTRFRSIELAATGAPRDSYSFLNASAINPPEISAAEFYRKVFGPDFLDPNAPTFTPDPKIMLRKSVLSAVSEERKDLERVLGAEDKARLDQYFTSVREMEGRMELQLQKPPAAPNCKVPAEAKEVPNGIEADIVGARHRAMTDLLAMALVCNQTKVFNMVYSNSGSSVVRKGVDKSHHAFTHEERIDDKLGYQPTSSWFVNRAMEEWGYMVEKLASTPEGDGSLLDRCLVFAHTDCQVAKAHSIDRIPMMTAGKLNGKAKTGLHIDGKGQPGTQVGFTMQRLMGVPIGNWGTKSLAVSKEVSELVA